MFLSRATPTLLMVLALGGAGACTGPEGDAAAQQHPQLWTPYDIVSALEANAPLAVDATFPSGLLPQDIMTPQGDGTAVLKIGAAFAEEWAAAYVITDVWRGYTGIWAQPWYYLVTSWNETAPFASRLRDAAGTPVPPLFDVEPSSNFYSPFWVTEFAVVPADADPARYQSTKAIFDDRLPVHLAGGVIWALHPDTVTLPRDPADATKIKLTHPRLGSTFTGFTDTPNAVSDGEVFPSFTLGRDNFLYDQQFLIEEVPLFLLAVRGADGEPQSLGAPPVAGVGPLLRGVPAQMGATAPRLKSYYRFTWALVPATAAVFDPAAYPDAAALVAARLDAAGKPLAPALFDGRVALNAFRAATATAPATPDCFASPSFPDACLWLDSQAHVESRLGAGALKPTAVTACAPMIPVGAPVSPAP